MMSSVPTELVPPPRLTGFYTLADWVANSIQNLRDIVRRFLERVIYAPY